VSPQTKISEYQRTVENLSNTADKLISDALTAHENKIKTLAAKLEGLNPISVLSRGYSIAEKDGQVINSKSQLKQNDCFTLEFSDGKINAKAIGE
jgi:exodeoxyribonuclease VII large subunit